MEQREEQQQGALQQAPPVLQRSAAWQQQQSQVHASEAMLGPSMSAQLRVLVVDSKAASRLNVTQLLSDCAYRVRVALVPKRALSLLSSLSSAMCAPRCCGATFTARVLPLPAWPHRCRVCAPPRRRCSCLRPQRRAPSCRLTSSSRSTSRRR